MKSFILFTIIGLFFSSCSNRYTEKELCGMYVPVGYKNTFDSIQLKPQGVYHRKVCDKNNKLVLDMNGKWSLERNNIIHFDSYFFNLDRDVTKFPELLQDTSGGGGGSIETRKGVLGFCVGYHENENCYKKIK
jgi:hypothetical protein